MGGKSKEESTTVKTNTPTIGGGLLDNLLGKVGSVDSSLTGVETTALNALSNMGLAGHPFAGQLGGVATDLLRGGGPSYNPMIENAYKTYVDTLTPTARGDHVDPAKNPALQGYLGTIANDIQNRVNGMFAGAGRDLSGMNQQALARGLTEGQAPVLLDAYTRARGDQLTAQERLFGAGMQAPRLLAELDQQRMSNQRAGIDAATAATQAQVWGPQQALAAEAQRRGITLDALTRLMGMALPTAQAFATQSGQSTTTKETPFNPLSLASLALAPISPTSLAGMGIAGVGSLIGSPGGYDPMTPGDGAPRVPTGLFRMFG